MSVHGAIAGLDPDFYKALQRLAREVEFPLHVSSGHRPDDLASAHSTGKAVDIAVSNASDRFDLLEAAFRLGFTRIGVYDKHIHLDLDLTRPRAVCWTGTSR